MKAKNLIILAILAIILVAAALKTSKKNAGSSPDTLGKAVFPALVVDDVEKIAVISAEGTAVVARVNDVWAVPDRYNYPADFAKVKDYMLKVSDMKIGQVMKLDAKQKAAMKIVMPPGTPAESNNTGTLLDLHGRNNTVLASLLIGEARMRKPGSDMPDYGGYPDGHYVSPDSGKSVFLVNSALAELPRNARNWMDQDLLNISSSDIKEISITGPDRQETKIIRKEGSSGFQVAGLSTNETTVESKMYSIESALSYLRLDDVADPEMKPEMTGLDKPTVFTALGQKGEIYTVKLGKKKDGTDYRYLRIETALKDAEKQPEPKDDNEKKKFEEAAKERKELEEKVKTLNEKLAKWIYLVSSQKTESMTPARDTLIEKKKEEDKKDAEADKPSDQDSKKDSSEK